MDSKHTPGPWTFAGKGICTGADGHLVCRIGKNGGRNRVDIDNARLIAESPAMLGQLREASNGLRWAGEHGYIETMDWELYCKRIDALLSRIDGD